MKLKANDIPKTIQVFQNYGKQVKRYSRMILEQRGKGGTLKNSIDYEVNYSDSKISVGIDIKSPADEYWAYVESGVEGREKKLPNVGKNSDLFGFPNFKFKGKNIAEGIIESWIQKKGIKGRDSKGRFITNKSLSFLIGRSIATRGLPWTGFLSQPILTQNQNIANELLDAFGEDIMNKLNFELKVK